jgi:hypothetical protein
LEAISKKAKAGVWLSFLEEFRVFCYGPWSVLLKNGILILWGSPEVLGASEKLYIECSTM